MKDVLVVLNGHRRVVYWSEGATALLGLSSNVTLGIPIEEVLRANPLEFESPQSVDNLLGLLCLSNKEPNAIDVVLLQPQRRELVVKALPIPIGGGEIFTALLLRDGTDEREMERRRDEFISALSHELRDPITSILGFLRLLVDQDSLTPIHREWIAIAYRCCEQLKDISTMLLDVVRIESGNLEVKPERLDLHRLFDDVLTVVAPESDNHDFVLEMEPGLPDVIANRIRLTQVLGNLICNAVKYSPRGGRVGVAARHEPGRERVVIAVSDQGMGIAAEHREYIFGPFQRVTSSETKDISGVGLGLYLAKGLVELMQGDIWLESKLGRGTTFFFSVPTSREEDQLPISSRQTNGLEGMAGIWSHKEGSTDPTLVNLLRSP